uniref:Folylpolyglutamate synthase n=1 Tax=Arcella intermedia TaxID=1963864 RepID=A0A6B2L287_9EUKA
MQKSKTFNEAVIQLNTLQSNSEAIQHWTNFRTTNKTESQSYVLQTMNKYANQLSLDISSLSRRSIHVTGTKGKGSTCAMTESIIRNHGFKTGLYTSPHLISVRERIKLNGESISEQSFSDYFWEVYDKLSSLNDPFKISYFWFLTIMSFYIFEKEKVDCAIIEVGIGGRTDCTNILDFPVACGIATIDYDHMTVLGNTLQQIAYEKSGIFKRGSLAVTVPQVPEPHKQIIERSIELGSPLYITRPWANYETLSGPISIPEGDFQKTNASLAVALSAIWLQKRGNVKLGVDLLDASSEISSLPPLFPVFQVSDVFKKGLQETQWPGRAQKISQFCEYPNLHLFLDGAHTPTSISAAKDWFRSATSKHKGPQIHLLCFNNKTGKPSEKLLSPLVEYSQFRPFQKVFFVNSQLKQLNYSKVKVIEEDSKNQLEVLTKIWRDTEAKDPTSSPIDSLARFETVDDAFEELKGVARDNKDKEVLVFVTGSLYLVGAFLELLDFKF